MVTHPLSPRLSGEHWCWKLIFKPPAARAARRGGTRSRLRPPRPPPVPRPPSPVPTEWVVGGVGEEEEGDAEKQAAVCTLASLSPCTRSHGLLMLTLQPAAGVQGLRPCAQLSWSSLPWPSSCADSSLTESNRTQEMSVRKRWPTYRLPSLGRNDSHIAPRHQVKSASLEQYPYCPYGGVSRYTFLSHP
ncbi:hypothetical protein SKAU_G00124050 [Synaphobranchus kaupii]|uniref:Uncharacterized protein n=1 Tax=Synaphobranchus kaupii TaxID=118154 RepID=A0A9Q1J1Q5_SYNKA|nr:hypothetical protein SKAU_G00124050 [Synaphobranchus kaupii]